MSKHLQSVVAGLVFGSLVLFSCSQDNPTTSVSKNNADGVGTAVVCLPDLSAKRLQKLPAGVVDSNALTLLITASDMDTIRYSWPFAGLKGQTVVIEGIPAGSNRTFAGFVTASGKLIYGGKVAVQITAQRTVPVNLKLSGIGMADVCIEIDGYPSACNQKDTLSVFSCLNGTSSKGPVTGSIKMNLYGNYVKGTMALHSSKPDTTIIYDIEESFTVKDSSGYKYYQTYAAASFNMFNFVLNKNAELVSGKLSQKVTWGTEEVANIYSVKCDSTIPSDTTLDDTISLSSCIKGNSPSDPLVGKFDMFIKSNAVTGSFNLTYEKTGNSFGTYTFEKLIDFKEFSNRITCQTMVIDMATKKRHCLNMTIMDTKQITYSYLSTDSLYYSPAIAKFISVSCDTTSK